MRVLVNIRLGFDSLWLCLSVLCVHENSRFVFFSKTISFFAVCRDADDLEGKSLLILIVLLD